MIHRTSHHLGLDVHDCAKPRRELYVDGVRGMTSSLSA
jgi:Xaa-Pro aminopeptidase